MKSNGHTSGAAVIGVICTFSFLSYVAVALRLWTRFKIHRQPGVDDALIVVATCFNIVMCLSMTIQVPYGLTRHMNTIKPDDLEKMMFWFWLSIWNYYGAQGFAKLSILFQYLRIFGNVRKFRLACYVVIALCIFYTAWGIITSMLICIPIPGFWHLEWQTNGRAKCMDMWKVKIPIWFFNAAMNMLTDILIAVIPLPVIRTLNLPKKQRIMLMGVFCLGGLVCIISIVRLSGLYAIAVSHDPSYDNPLAALWSATQANFTTLASCLPVLKGLFGKYFPRMFKGSTNDAHDLYGTDLSGPSHSRLPDNDATLVGTQGSGRGQVWGKKQTTIHVEISEAIDDSHSPDSIQMQPIGRTMRPSRESNESREKLVPLGDHHPMALKEKESDENVAVPAGW